MHDRPLFAEAPADVIAVFLLNRPTNVTVLVGWESAANAGHPRTGRNCQFSLPPSPPSVRRACCFLDQKRRSGPTIGTPSVISITAASVRPGRPSCRSKGERAKQRTIFSPACVSRTVEPFYFRSGSVNSCMQQRREMRKHSSVAGLVCGGDVNLSATWVLSNKGAPLGTLSTYPLSAVEHIIASTLPCPRSCSLYFNLSRCRCFLDGRHVCVRQRDLSLLSVYADVSKTGGFDLPTQFRKALRNCCII